MIKRTSPLFCTMEEYLTLGKIIDTFSLDGSLKIISSSTNQDIRYKKGNIVFIKLDNEYKPLTVVSHRRSSTFDIVKFEEIKDVDEAKLLKGKELYVIKDRNDLKEGYYFYSDLRGCSIVADGKTLGEVKEVEEFPAQITLRCKAPNGKEFFVPFVEAFIISVDIKKKEIIINYMEGLL